MAADEAINVALIGSMALKLAACKQHALCGGKSDRGRLRVVEANANEPLRLQSTPEPVTTKQQERGRTPLRLRPLYSEAVPWKAWHLGHLVGIEDPTRLFGTGDTVVAKHDESFYLTSTQIDDDAGRESLL